MRTDIQDAVDKYKRTNDESDLKTLVHLLEIYASHEVSKRNDPLEAKSDLNYVIYKAVNSYDPSKKIKFITFFWSCYKNFIRNYLYRQSMQKRSAALEVLSINYFYDDGDENNNAYMQSKSHEIHDRMLQLDIQHFISSVENRRHAFILQKISNEFTVPEIANMLNVHKHTVYNDLKKFRTQPEAQKLYQMLKE
jgi:RNA polymerase sigma factor (sigma-70 family)